MSSSSTAQIGLRIFIQDSASAGLGALGLSMGRLGYQAGYLSQAWTKLGPGMQQVAILAGVSGIAFAGLADMLRQSIDAASNLQTAMVGVYDSVQGATNNATAMQNELIQLADTSIYSTTEIAQGFQQMGVNGQNATDILQGTGYEMTILAEATQSQVVPAAELLSTTMQLMGQNTKQAAQDVQDLTFMFYNGQASIANVKDALKAVGAEAEYLHVSMNDLSVALAYLGESGLKGAAGGLALKNMLVSLTAPTANAQKALSQLGIIAVNNTNPALWKLVDSLAASGKAGKAAADAYDGSVYQLQLIFNAAHKLGLVKTDETFYAWAISAGILKDKLFDVHGNFIGLKNSIDLVRAALKGLNPEQQAALISQIFNKTSLKAAQEFFGQAQNGAAKWAELNDKLNNTSPMTDATRATNTLAGSTKVLSTTWNSALASVGQFLQGPLTQFNLLMNQLLGTFVSAPPAVHQAVAIFLVLATAITGVIFVGGVIAVVIAMFGSALATAAPIIAGVAGGLAVLGVIVAVVMANWKQISAFIQPAVQAFQQFAQLMRTVLMPVFKEFQAQLKGDLGAEMKDLQTIIQTQFIPTWNNLKAAFITIEPGLMIIAKILGFIGLVFFSVFLGIIAGAIRGVVGLIMGLVIVFSGVFGVISGILMILAGIFKIVVMPAIDLLTGHWQKANQDIFGGLEMLWHGVQAVFGGIATIIAGVFLGVLGFVSGFVMGFVQTIISFFTHLYDTLVGHSIIPDMVKAIVQWFINLHNMAVSVVMGFITHLIATFMRAVGMAHTAFTLLQSAVIAVLTGMVGRAIGMGQSIVHGIINGVTSMGGNAVAAMLGLANKMIGAFKSIFHIASPSQVMHEMGTHLSQGLINGLQSLDVAGEAAKHYGKIASSTQLALHAQAAASLVIPNRNGLALAGAQASAQSAANSTQHYHIEMNGKELMGFVMDGVTNQLRATGASRLLR